MMVHPPLILLLEDDPVLRELMVRTLVDGGCPVLEGGNGRIGLELAKSHHGSLALVITDISMREMDGIELARAVRVLFPTVPILFTTGHPDRYDSVNLPNCELLQKPFGPDQLMRTVKHLLAEPWHESSAASQ